MPVTLTDEQAAQVRQHLEHAERNRQVAEMVNGIYNDPALGEEARALIKKKYPNLPIPDHDLRTEFNKRLDKERADRDAADKAARDKAADAAQQAARKKVQTDYGFTDDGLKKVEDFMVERNIPDYEVAAHYVAAQNPKPSDDTADYDRHLWNHGRSDDEKKIAADPEGWAQAEILKAIRADQRTNR